MSDPLRVFTHAYTLAEVAHAVSLTSRASPLIYVERRGDAYRWSPAHRGGPYPLLRTVAEVLGVDHRGLVLPFQWRDACIVGVPRIPPPDSWALLELHDEPNAMAVQRNIELTLGVPTYGLN